MAPEQSARRRATPLWAKVALIAGGAGCGLALATGALLLFPGLLGDSDPQQRRSANTTIQVNYRPSNGELFVQLPGKIRPPQNDDLLESFTLSWDADSFRVPRWVSDHYPIAAFGDSFTEGYNVPVPWPDGLAEQLNVPVRNYGYRAYGPLEIAATVRDFAADEPRRWVLVAFFAGNDLFDATRSAALAERSPFYLLPQLASQAAERMSTEVAQTNSEHYDFPMPVIIGGSYYEMAFLTYYLWRQIAPPQGFEASAAYQITRRSLDEINALIPPETCRALIFIPTKEQLYYPYIHPAERQWLRLNGFAQALDSSGGLVMEPRPYDETQEPDLIAHFDDLHVAVARLVADKPGWHFIDLLPAFEAAVGRGELLYYPYDTHWNQAGHTLAAQVIAESLRAAADCPLS